MRRWHFFFTRKVNSRQRVERWERQRGVEMRQSLSAQFEVLKSDGQMDGRWRNKQIIMVEIIVASMRQHVISHWHGPTQTAGLKLKVGCDTLFYSPIIELHIGNSSWKKKQSQLNVHLLNWCCVCQSNCSHNNCLSTLVLVGWSNSICNPPTAFWHGSLRQILGFSETHNP